MCPGCDYQTKRHGYEPYERSWRYANCLFFPCDIHCQRPKVWCEKCGAQQINAPFERQGSWFTLLFEGYAMMILAYWVDRATDKQALSDLSKLALDEISKRRGHQYITVVIAALQRTKDVQIS